MKPSGATFTADGLGVPPDAKNAWIITGEIGPNSTPIATYPTGTGDIPSQGQGEDDLLIDNTKAFKRNVQKA